MNGNETYLVRNSRTIESDAYDVDIYNIKLRKKSVFQFFKEVSIFLFKDEHWFYVQGNQILMSDITRRNFLAQFIHTKEVKNFTFSSSSNFLISLCADHCIRVWDLNSNRCISRFNDSFEQNDYEQSLAFFMLNEEIIVNVSKFKDLPGIYITFHSLSSGQCIKKDNYNFSHIAAVDKKIVAFAGHSNLSIKIYDLHTGHYLSTINHSWYKCCKIINQDILATTENNNPTIFLWDIKTGMCIKQLCPKSNNKSSSPLLCSHEDNSLASDYNGTISLWKLPSYEELLEFRILRNDKKNNSFLLERESALA